MIGEHWFWWLLTMACVVWYCTITVYVAFKGTADIKSMLARLGDPPEAGREPPGDAAKPLPAGPDDQS
jgi:hypothetical protein